MTKNKTNYFRKTKALRLMERFSHHSQGSRVCTSQEVEDSTPVGPLSSATRLEYTCCNSSPSSLTLALPGPPPPISQLKQAQRHEVLQQPALVKAAVPSSTTSSTVKLLFPTRGRHGAGCPCPPCQNRAAARKLKRKIICWPGTVPWAFKLELKNKRTLPDRLS